MLNNHLGGESMGTEEHIFKRYEVKYLLSGEQYQELRQRLDGHLIEDTYGETEICNCYYDTPDFRLIRNSMEKTAYKEKLRLRSYGVPDSEEAQVFLELKKKFQGVVYKRRENLTVHEADAYLKNHMKPEKESQILKEIDWVLQYYQNLQPAMYLAYRRIAMFEKTAEEDGQIKSHNGNQDLRVTFDWDIRWRTEEIELQKGIYGQELLPSGQRIMEVKTPNAVPKWFADILDGMELYPCSFSKYGKAYQQWKQISMIKNIA